MGDRVLNFSEFSGKYSSEEERDITDVAGASDNFTDAFDEESYDSPEIKPNRPVADGESAIPSPDEDGAPSFTADVDSGMVAPSDDETELDVEVETEEEIEEPTEEIESEEEEYDEEIAAPAPSVEYDEDGGNPEDEEDDEDEEEDEEDEEDEEEDEDEEANESVKGLLKGFDSYIKG